MATKMDNPPTETGGVAPMSITGRMVRERERLMGMTDVERAWRAQWLKDQILAPDEPCVPENYYRERFNPLRRFYRAPLDKLEKALTKPLGAEGALFTRSLIGQSGLIILGICTVWYHFKYNASDWTKKSGWKVTRSRTAMFLNDPGFPNYEQRQDDDYVSFGFKNSPI